MKYCLNCGAKATLITPEGDNKQRSVCPQCQYIYYENPNIIAGAIPHWENKVLLCKRAIEPRYGYWTLPAGFMEMGESVEQAAQRETLEEAQAQIHITDLHAVISTPHIGQVYMLYRAELIAGKFGIGAESLECRLFTEDQIPWQELAFPTISYALKTWFADRAAGQYKTHQHCINFPLQTRKN